jgi:hypothetical protein
MTAELQISSIYNITFEHVDTGERLTLTGVLTQDEQDHVMSLGRKPDAYGSDPALTAQCYALRNCYIDQKLPVEFRHVEIVPVGIN